jgi:SanA protein
MPKKIRRYLILIPLLIVLIIIGVTDYFVNATTKTQIYTNTTDIPKNKVGLLLGTSKYKDKGKKIVNDYYQNRIIAAVTLYMAGKIDYIIVSGDNSEFYNEPILMRDDLIALGVPSNIIILDNAGFRTLDSILRCRDIFGQNRFTIISQAFHNKRAIYIANHKNISAVGFNAEDGIDYWGVNLREQLARIKMMIDIVLNRQAKLYGDKIEIK